MRSSSRRVLAGTPVAVAAALAVPLTARGQTLGSRPASVALTVVVPSRAQPDTEVTTAGDTWIVRGTAHAVDVMTAVDAGGRPVSRVDVRLGASWESDSARVWIRNSSGRFEPLEPGASVVAVDVPRDAAVARPPLVLRVETAAPAAALPTAVPLEYRLRVGSGDQFAVWSFSTRVPLTGGRAPRAPAAAPPTR